jgi:uncharacterized membrane protein YfcA
MLLAAVLSLLIGAVLGMLGGGGSMLTLPMLVYAVGTEPRAAIAASLVVVGATAAVGAVLHGRGGHVRGREGLVFGAMAMLGSFAGSRLSRHLSVTALMLLFAAVMVATGLTMLRGAEGESAGSARPRLWASALLAALAVGVLSGLIGAGGGFLIVPALVIFGGLPVRDAIGTSLLVIALQSGAALVGHIGRVELDVPLLVAVTLASTAGSVAGVRLGRALSVARLRRWFAWLVLGMAVFVAAQHLPASVTVLAALALVAIAHRVARAPETPRGPKNPRTR